jgi:3-isopropylmalate dehydrogenase
MRITRDTCERLFAFSFELARARKLAGRPGRVTCVDKANVIPSLAFFRQVFLECAARYPDVDAECAYVDAVGLRLVRAPWDFDVMVTENMFGDILSDVGAALLGGMGMAPSADIGDSHAVFQPCHGSAPDINGRGLANPTAMFLSAAMMLEWLGRRHDVPEAARAASAITRAVDTAFADGTLITPENGGDAGTAAVTARVFACLSEGSEVRSTPA